MDLSNIISTTESLLYQVAVWLVLVPKTLFRVIAAPTWIPEYITRELAKPQESRFDDHVSPLLFFVILTIVPNLIANAYWPQIPYTDFATARKIVGQAQTLSGEHRFFLYALIWMLLPLSFALVHLLAQKGELSGSQLKPLLYAQCLRVARSGCRAGAGKRCRLLLADLAGGPVVSIPAVSAPAAAGDSHHPHSGRNRSALSFEAAPESASTP